MLKDGPVCERLRTACPSLLMEGREVFHDPFPSLIIQDEAHLLEESLGTFAGLFETMLEQLFVRASDLLGASVSRGVFLALNPYVFRRLWRRQPRLVFRSDSLVLFTSDNICISLIQAHQFYRSFYAAPAKPADPARRGIGGRGTTRTPK